MLKNNLNARDIRKGFPMLAADPDLVYLDSAASSQTPESVIRAVEAFYRDYRANVHRGMYKASEHATDEYENARGKVARFINAGECEVIFTRGATESLNILASSLGRDLGPGDEVVLTGMEHHANLVPWQQKAKERGFGLRVIPVKDGERLDMDEARKIIGPATKVVSVIWASNVLGTVNPVGELVRVAKEAGAITVLDAAQAMCHVRVDVKDLDCDFLAFSGHKMFGPTGIGVLYGKEERLRELRPFMYGGDMIREVSWEDSSWNDVPWKFEAGTPNIAGAIGLGAAVDYVGSVGLDIMLGHEERVLGYALTSLSSVNDLAIHGPRTAEDRVGAISFTVKGTHPHDMVTLLDRENVAVRGGHHCAMPLVRDLGLVGTTRASLSVYNDEQDIDALVRAIEKAKKVFKIT